MKKIILIISTFFLLTSCLVVSKNDIETNKEPIVESTNIIVEDKTNTWKTLTWNIDKGIIDTGNWKTLTGEVLGEEKQEKLTIEEQYCVSKWWKLVTEKDRKICYTTDDKWLLKCEVKIFYFDMCRSKWVTTENWVIVWMKKIIDIVEKKKDIVNTWSLKFDLEVDSKDEKTENKSKEETKILSWSSSISQEKEVIKEQNNKEQNNKEQKDNLDKGTYIVKELQWKSWKYFILVWTDWSTDFRMVTNSWANISLYSWKSNSWIDTRVIYDYELLINKQIKVFYYKWEEKNKEEKIIDLNNL